jgi:hypothetical protein
MSRHTLWAHNRNVRIEVARLTNHRVHLTFCCASEPGAMSFDVTLNNDDVPALVDALTKAKELKE